MSETSHHKSHAACAKHSLLLWGAVVASSWSLTALPSTPSLADAPNYVVIVHPSTPTASTTHEFVAQAFLKRVTHWPHGETIRPVDLPPRAAARRAFSTSILKRSVEAVRSYWQQRIFSGRELPPPELNSDEEVVRYVQSVPGAMGYVSRQAKLVNTRVLTVE